MTTSHSTRILTLDVHPLSFGFVVTEGPDRLIDWGVRSFRHGVNAVKVPMSKKLALLLDEYRPDVLVIREPRAGISRRMELIVKSAAARRIILRTIAAESIRATFPDSNLNKHQIATAAAAHYPELSLYLPAKRKPWQSEKYGMSVFEAAALGLTYFRRHRAAKKT
jgi:hypothetical protein